MADNAPPAATLSNEAAGADGFFLKDDDDDSDNDSCYSSHSFDSENFEVIDNPKESTDIPQPPAQAPAVMANHLSKNSMTQIAAQEITVPICCNLPWESYSLFRRSGENPPLEPLGSGLMGSSLAAKPVPQQPAPGATQASSNPPQTPSWSDNLPAVEERKRSNQDPAPSAPAAKRSSSVLESLPPLPPSELYGGWPMFPFFAPPPMSLASHGAYPFTSDSWLSNISALLNPMSNSSYSLPTVGAQPPPPPPRTLSTAISSAAVAAPPPPPTAPAVQSGDLAEDTLAAATDILYEIRPGSIDEALAMTKSEFAALLNIDVADLEVFSVEELTTVISRPNAIEIMHVNGISWSVIDQIIDFFYVPPGMFGPLADRYSDNYPLSKENLALVEEKSKTEFAKILNFQEEDLATFLRTKLKVPWMIKAARCGEGALYGVLNRFVFNFRISWRILKFFFPPSHSYFYRVAAKANVAEVSSMSMNQLIARLNLGKDNALALRSVRTSQLLAFATSSNDLVTFLSNYQVDEEGIERIVDFLFLAPNIPSIFESQTATPKHPFSEDNAGKVEQKSMEEFVRILNIEGTSDAVALQQSKLRVSWLISSARDDPHTLFKLLNEHNLPRSLFYTMRTYFYPSIPEISFVHAC